MRRTIASFVIGTMAVLLVILCHTSSTYDDKLSSKQIPVECCITDSANFFNKHYLVASTIDGEITAMDIEKNGEIVWIVDADKVPLLSSSFNQQELEVDNFPYMLVPLLDGSLYIFNVKNNSLNPIPLSTNARMKIGNDEIAGGSFVTSTGVDPLTGKMRYRCTAGKCTQYEAKTNDSSVFTLIMRRNTQIARAADPVTGAEKWSLSVGEYDISLVSSDHSLRFEQASESVHIRFLLESLSGSVSAVDNCGNLKWVKRLSSPIVRAWQLSHGRISEIPLFSSKTTGALSDFDGSVHPFITKYEAPFYFESYIIPSKFRREELLHASENMQIQYHPQISDSFYYSRAPFLENLKVEDLIRRSYRTIRSVVEANRINNVRDSPVSKSLTCNMYDTITVAENKKLEGNNESKGGYGWYIFRPLLKSCQTSNPFQERNQRKYGSSYNYICRQKNILEGLKQTTHGPVSGWWKIVALFLSIIASSFALIIFYWQHIWHLKLFVLLHDFRKRCHTYLNISLPSSREIKCSNADEIVIGTKSRMSRKKSTAVSQSTQELFSSKFLDDFVPEKWLGRGGYGVVFKCRNRLDDRSYAVKRIAVSNATAAIEHVKREARAMARLDHPGIIRYFHTWMEKPPSGWQQAKDKEILLDICCLGDSESKSVMQTLKSEQNIIELGNLTAKDASLSEELLHALNLNMPVNESCIIVNDDNTNLSWVGDDNGSEPITATDSASSSLDNDSESVGHGITAIATGFSAGSNDSADVIFAHCGNSLHSTEEVIEKKLKNSASMSPLQPPVVLVTNTCDLQSCMNIKDYVYLYIQMELCQELTLHSWLLANSSDEDREITRMRRWLAELVCAIDYIHSQGLIHRDLKPQNIFFSADNYLKIGDLGLVTNYINEERTECKQDIMTNIFHTSHVGTRLYMSPEQLKGKPYNEKVDVFSLGLIFVELIVPCKTVMERNNILSNLQNGIMPKRLENFSSEEKEFVSWLTVVDPELRPSARQLAECDYLHNEMHILGTSYFREHTALEGN